MGIMSLDEIERAIVNADLAGLAGDVLAPLDSELLDAFGFGTLQPRPAIGPARDLALAFSLIPPRLNWINGRGRWGGAKARNAEKLYGVTLYTAGPDNRSSALDPTPIVEAEAESLTLCLCLAAVRLRKIEGAAFYHPAPKAPQ